MMVRLKRWIAGALTILLVVGLLPNYANAATITSRGKCGKNAKWSFNTKTRTLTISGKGTIKYSWPESVFDGKVKIIIKEGITGIGDDAFTELDIKKISLPNSLTYIGNTAFGPYCVLPSITIPQKVKKIGSGAFLCYDMKSIKVAKGNKYYSSENGVLYNKTKAKLIACPMLKKGTLNIPAKTKTICENAFMGSHLTKIVVPKSVKTVKSDAFMWTEDSLSIYFKGKPPKGIKQELNDEVYAKEIYIPEKYYNDWADCVYNSTYKGKWNTWNP